VDGFSTPRLRAERLDAGDYGEIRRMHLDADTMAALGGVQSEAQSRAYMDRNLRHWAERGFGLWIVYEQAGTTPIGRAVLRHVTVDGRDEVEVGYAFYREFRGRGYATEVTGACVSLAFDRLGRHDVIALTTAGNAASQRVLARSGFSLEGTVQLDGVDLQLFRRVRETASAPAR
jgi:RimJ/RimL family protein N-acetyltransferase